MTRTLTFEELVSEVPGLTPSRLERYVEAEIVIPVQAGAGAICFHPLDRARLTLACELAEQFELQDDALAVVLHLVDQMHVLRADLRNLMRAVEAQPAQTRREIGAWLQAARARRR